MILHLHSLAIPTLYVFIGSHARGDSLPFDPEVLGARRAPDGYPLLHERFRGVNCILICKFSVKNLAKVGGNLGLISFIVVALRIINVVILVWLWLVAHLYNWAVGLVIAIVLVGLHGLIRRLFGLEVAFGKGPVFERAAAMLLPACVIILA